MTTNSLGNKFVLVIRGLFYTGEAPSEIAEPSAEGAESVEEAEAPKQNYRYNVHGKKGRFVKTPRPKGSKNSKRLFFNFSLNLQFTSLVFIAG